MRKPNTGALLGLKVIDMTRLLPGPLATMLMGDMGAEIIKIELPNAPDYARNFPPHKNGESLAFLAFNHSKQSLALDYQTEKGKQILLDLVKDAAIFIEQFRPTYLAKIGLGYEDLKKINPKIIYVSLTGYGQTGKYKDLAGHDLNYIGFAGLLSGNRFSPPQMPIAQMADIAGGSYMAVIGCLAALYARERTGEGQWVDVAMLDGSMPLAINTLSWYWTMGKPQAREQGFLSGGMINYGIYPCKDGKFVALGTLEVKFWQKFCTLIQKEEWTSRMIAPDKTTFMEWKNELTAVFQTQDSAYWVSIGLENDLLISPIYEADEVDKDEHIKARNMVVEVEHPKAGKIKNMGAPIKFSATPAQVFRPSPLLGEDSEAILKEMGISESAIQELKSKGIIK
ncbi:MAG: CoA transferase [Cytophagales bacterium]|nr:MAG: CoA transferase [Cytophagales bacterium]